MRKEKVEKRQPLKNKKQYRPPRIRKRERLAEITGKQRVGFDGLITP